jgi:hypothetical protein
VAVQYHQQWCVVESTVRPNCAANLGIWSQFASTTAHRKINSFYMPVSLASVSDSVSEATTKDLTCGLVMPISTIDGCTGEHWAEVKSILIEAVDSLTEPCFKTRMVSEADETGVIQKRIVQNVYTSDIIVCDVSGKNPNVMFELGMRLAFDKPVVIVKDDKTDYSFDTGIISRIVEFKTALSKKVANTYLASSAPDSSPFLKNFGRFHVATLQQTEVSPDRLVLEAIDDMRREVHMLRRRFDMSPRKYRPDPAAYDDAWIGRVISFVQQILVATPSPTPYSLIGDAVFERLARENCDPSGRVSEGEFSEMLNRILRMQLDGDVRADRVGLS